MRVASLFDFSNKTIEKISKLFSDFIFLLMEFSFCKTIAKQK